MRLIDADALITELTEWMQKPDRDDVSVNVVDHLIGALKNEPSIDAEQVVRCKDCKHKYTDITSFAIDLGYDGECPVTSLLIRDDMFCWWGARKDNE